MPPRGLDKERVFVKPFITRFTSVTLVMVFGLCPIHAEESPSAAPVSPPPQVEEKPSVPRALSWPEKISARLISVKHCPKEKAPDGAVQIGFTIKVDGSVADSHVVTSSGTPALDREALDMLGRANPFPPPPSGEDVSFTVPIRFACAETAKPDPITTDYFNKVFAHLSKSFPPRDKFSATKKVMIFLRVNDSGNLEKVEIFKSSGDPEFDEETKALVQKAAPVPKPPKGARRDIYFTHAANAP